MADSLVVGKHCRGAGRGGGQLEATGEPVDHAPPEKSPGYLDVLGVLDVPRIDVGLAAGGQGEASPGQPPEEDGGLPDLLGGEASARRGDRLPFGAGAEPREDFSGGELADDLGVTVRRRCRRDIRRTTARASRLACR